MTKLRPLLIGAIACLALATYTSYKLYRMARIRGYIGAPPIEERIVEGKTSRDTRGRYGTTTTCWLYAGDDRIQADCGYWATVRAGDRIEVVTVDGELFLNRGEIYTSDGNFVFDFVLLAIELGGLITCLTLLVRRR